MNDIIMEIPRHAIDNWIMALPEIISVSDRMIAAVIAAMRYDLGLKPIQINIQNGSVL
jgi:hypothetical protein